MEELQIVKLSTNNENEIESYDFDEVNGTLCIVSDDAVNKFLTGHYNQEIIDLDYGNTTERYDVITYGVITSKIYLQKHLED